MKKKNITIISITIIIGLIIFLIYNSNANNNGDLLEIKYPEIVTKQENKEDFILIVSQSTCSHCASYKPKVKQIAKEYGIIAYYMDLDKNKNEDTILKELNLSGATPVTLFFKNGKETSILNRIEGDLAEKTIIKQFKKMGFID